MNQKLFFTLLRPIEAVLASISPIIDQASGSQKLFFADFVKKLIFAYLEQVSSLRSLSVELQTNRKCQALGFGYTPFSTLKDGFYRFSNPFLFIDDALLVALEIQTAKRAKAKEETEKS